MFLQTRKIGVHDTVGTATVWQSNVAMSTTRDVRVNVVQQMALHYGRHGEVGGKKRLQLSQLRTLERSFPNEAASWFA